MRNKGCCVINHDLATFNSFLNFFFFLSASKRWINATMTDCHVYNNFLIFSPVHLNSCFYLLLADIVNLSDRFPKYNDSYAFKHICFTSIKKQVLTACTYPSRFCFLELHRRMWFNSGIVPAQSRNRDKVRICCFQCAK